MGHAASQGHAAHTKAKPHSTRHRDAPLRLEHDERKLLRLLEGALRVSEYVDIVDVLSFRSELCVQTPFTKLKK